MDYTDIYSSPLGHITLAGQGDHLIGLWFEGQKHFGSALTPGCRQGRPPVLAAARAGWTATFRERTPVPRLLWRLRAPLFSGRCGAFSFRFPVGR